jgi:hypothetical protein
MQNFIIIGTQRTGSSALAESIGLIPEVCCGGEFTNPLPHSLKIKAAQIALYGDFSLLSFEGRKNIEKYYTTNVHWLGFRWLFPSSSKWFFHPRFSPALWWERMEHFIDWVKRKPNIRIVHIIRNNNLDWLKSVYLAKKTKLYSQKAYPEGVKIRIPKWEAINRVRAKNWVDSRLSSLKDTNPYLGIDYEDFLEEQDGITATVLKFLDCDSTNLYSKNRSLKKQSKYSVSDYLLNYEQLFATLSEKGLILSSNKKISRI